MRLSHLGIPLCAAMLSSTLASVASAQEPPPPPPPPVARPAPPEGRVVYVEREPAPPPPATERTANNALYIEGLGAGLFYSLNYDHAFGPIAPRIGIGYFSLSGASWVTVPITVSYLGIGSLKHMFEVGAGVSINQFGASASFAGASSSGSATEVYGVAILGYRYQPPEGGFFLRAGVSPIFGGGSNGGFFLPWPHLGLGATF
jgi:hypothetical protein